MTSQRKLTVVSPLCQCKRITPLFSLAHHHTVCNLKLVCSAIKIDCQSSAKSCWWVKRILSPPQFLFILVWSVYYFHLLPRHICERNFFGNRADGHIGKTKRPSLSILSAVHWVMILHHKNVIATHRQIGNFDGMSYNKAIFGRAVIFDFWVIKSIVVLILSKMLTRILTMWHNWWPFFRIRWKIMENNDTSTMNKLVI